MSQTTLTRVAGIDPFSGYVFGVADNLPPNLSDNTLMRHAAANILNNADTSRRYDPAQIVECERRDKAAVLHLYAIDGTVEVYDGTDRETIAAVECGRPLATVARLFDD